MSSVMELPDMYLRIDADLGDVITDLKGTAIRFWDDYVIKMGWSGGGGPLNKRLCDGDLLDIAELFSIHKRNLKKDIDLLYRHKEGFSLEISLNETKEEWQHYFVYYGIKLATGRLHLNFDLSKESKVGELYNLLDADKFCQVVQDVIEKWTTDKSLKEQAGFSNDYDTVISTATTLTQE